MKKKRGGKEEEAERDRFALNRRDFLASVGAGALVTASACRPATTVSPGPLQVGTTEEMSPVALNVNGRSHRLLVEPRWSLLFVLREKIGLTGTKIGCERGECGACTVLIDDLPRYACQTLAVEAAGAQVTTVEGVMQGEALGPVQQAFVEHDAFQCGYCTPGQIMAVEGLLRAQPNPTLEQIRQGVSGNLCRCGAYVNIFKAAQSAARLKRSQRGE